MKRASINAQWRVRGRARGVGASSQVHRLLLVMWSSSAAAFRSSVSHAGDRALVLEAPKLTCRVWAHSSLRKSTKAA